MAIELLMACQAIDLLSPLTSTPPLQAVHNLVRQTIPYVLSLFTSINLSY
jgi:histidine ammonia-lyase